MPASAQAVYNLHAEPDALERLTPPREKSQVVSRTGGIDKPGSRVILKVSIGPFTQNWIAEHTACEPGRMFRDVMVSGPFPRWQHTHEFLPETDSSSWLEDTVEYDFPLGWFGKLFGGAYTRRRLQRMFTWRHEMTTQILQERAKKTGGWQMADKTISAELLEKYKTQHGETIATLSAQQPVLLVFLRHFG